MKREIKEYAEREAEFLEKGRMLFFTKGYRNTSVNNIINSVGVAKGTFYHYFRSKEDLLDKIIDNFMKDIMMEVDEISKNKSLSAVEKLNNAFMSIRNLKFENIELMIVLMNTIYTNENILLRHKMFKEIISRLTPIWALIIEQGIREGVFQCYAPLETSELIFAMSTHLNENIVLLMSTIKSNPSIVKIIKAKVSAFENAIERLLGVSKNKIKIFNMSDFDVFVKSMLNNNG